MRVDIINLIGKTITKFELNEKKDELWIECSDGYKYHFYHTQDCCENVYLEDIIGDVQDIIGSPVLIAGVVSSSEDPPGKEKGGGRDSFTWTFYKINTIKGGITMRWYGESNGYYSERVDIYETTPSLA